MKKIKFLFILLATIANTYSNDSFITGVGKTYSAARTSAAHIVLDNRLRIIGQNHRKDKDGNWIVVLKVRPY